MNRVILIGRFTRSPELYHNSHNGKEMDVAKFTLAVNNNYQNSKVNFINCVAFGRNALFCEKYCVKGMKILVEGEWSADSYKKDDGTVVYVNNCVVSRFEFVENKNVAESTKSGDGFMSIPDDIDGELPFEDSPF